MRSGRAGLSGMVIIVLALAMTLPGCSAGRPTQRAERTVVPSSTASAPGATTAPAATASPASPSREPSVAAAVRTLRRYLDQWVRRGPGVASRHLVLEQRSPATLGGSDLATWHIDSVELVRWHDRTDFTLYVSMVLCFDGERYAWNQGDNGRFVTAHKKPGRGPYLLEFATSP